MQESGASDSPGCGFTNFPLTPEDLGLQASDVSTLQGTLMVSGTTATAQIDMINATVASPFTVLSSLTSVAQSYGATTLRITATLANPQLYNILVARYGLVTEGGTDYIEIPIP